MASDPVIRWLAATIRTLCKRVEVLEQSAGVREVSCQPDKKQNNVISLYHLLEEEALCHCKAVVADLNPQAPPFVPLGVTEDPVRDFHDSANGRDLAATKIQQHFRGHQGRRRYDAVQKIHYNDLVKLNSAIKIQAMIRRHWATISVEEKRTALLVGKCREPNVEDFITAHLSPSAPIVSFAMHASVGTWLMAKPNWEILKHAREVTHQSCTPPCGQSQVDMGIISDPRAAEEPLEVPQEAVSPEKHQGQEGGLEELIVAAQSRDFAKMAELVRGHPELSVNVEAITPHLLSQDLASRQHVMLRLKQVEDDIIDCNILAQSYRERASRVADFPEARTAAAEELRRIEATLVRIAGTRNELEDEQRAMDFSHETVAQILSAIARGDVESVLVLASRLSHGPDPCA